ncbi:xanthine dehydrogenase family protein molybdopterin-binding subunit [Actinoplanes sp. M2I2]|uniref:xanthine dehydrogenase family protein molybdopterin-binding subunit n=1 Tax=Actinoplanes sp. M2I2 TaxID=1734444 RepID=UPI00202146E8|nr:xanthine dehydrogenase family protein molybdopterin-binding subunit [Actinoplanes sp. M2I2]
MTVSPLGREIDRVDGRSKVTGAARYSADYPAPNLAHAYVVTSTIARGTIRQMETAAARSAPGVIDVYGPDTPDRKLGLRLVPGAGEQFAPLADNLVRYRGQIIAVVIAESFEQAREAAALVTTTYDEQPARIELGDGPRTPVAAVGGHPTQETILAPGVDSIDAALAGSEVVVAADFHGPAQNHVALEVHAVLATWNRERTSLTMHSGAQIPHTHAQVITLQLGLNPPPTVRLIAPFVGGGFGGRIVPAGEAALAAALAYRVQRPVRLVLTREQEFTVASHRGRVDQTVRLGASRAGVLTVVSHKTTTEMPTVGAWNTVPAESTSGMLYKTPNLHLDQGQVVLDVPPTAAMRAPHEAMGSFALETAMDELAVATGIDPLTLRQRNYATVSPRSGLSFSSKHLDDCYRIGAQRFGWRARRAEPRSRVDGDWLIGMGTASAIYHGDRLPFPVGVRIRLSPDNTAVISSATADLGTGALTMLAITGAHELGIPLRRVTPEIGDTDLPPGAPAARSTATANTVAAVHSAATAVAKALIDLAVTQAGSPWYGADAKDLTYADGRVRGAGRSMSFGQLLSTVGRDRIEATATTQAGPELSEYEFYCFGAHFCEVRVNRFTGEPRISRFTSVVDIGRVINAQAARSQIVGGVIFGIGQALLEENPFEPGSGRMAAANMADYMLPVNADIPKIDVHMLDRPDPHINELGARGCGELGAVGSAAAIGNAIYNATGARIRSTPITLDKILEHLT